MTTAAARPSAHPLSPREELAALACHLGDDECRVLAWLAGRLVSGARVYGPLGLATDGRDFDRERAEEIADALAYTAMGEIARVLRAGKGTR